VKQIKADQDIVKKESPSDNDSDSDESSDDEAELQRELLKIKQERQEEEVSGFI
jgi:hypothetical protein